MLAPQRLAIGSHNGSHKPERKVDMTNAVPPNTGSVASIPRPPEADAPDWVAVAVALGVTTGTTIEAALAECERELQVRERCYPGWIKDGKLAKLDARDRFVRLRDACDILKNLLDKMPSVPEGTGGTDDIPF
jgi:hypothetical protein